MIELRNKQGQLIRISGSETIVSVDGEEMSLQEAIDNGKIGQTLTVVQVLSDSTEDVPSAAAVKGAVNAVAASVASLAENTAKLATEVDGIGKEVQEVSDTVDSLSEEVANKQNKLKAGDNITIDPDGTISATGGGGGGSVTIDKTMPATPSDSHAPSTKLLKTELDKKQIKLKAGDNITINPDGTISASLAGGTTQVASEVSYTNADGSKTNVQAKLTELEKVNNLHGKVVWTLGDSLCHNTWQEYFKQISGCEWYADLNIKSDKPISWGGTTSIPESDDGTQARALNLVSYKDIYPIDYVLIENVNDKNRLNRVSRIGTIEDIPFMRSKNVVVKLPVSTQSEIETYVKENLATIIEDVDVSERKSGTILSFPYSGGGYICGSKITFSGSVLNDGVISITWNNQVFATEVTKGMSIDDVINEIIKWSFGAGVTDSNNGDNSMSIYLYKETDMRVTNVDCGGTGLSATIQDSQGGGSVVRFFIGHSSSEWSDIANWTDNISLYSAYKGLIEYLQRELPSTKICFFTPYSMSVDFNSNDYKNADGTWSKDKFINSSAYQQQETLRELQKNVCERYNIEYLDLVRLCGIDICNMEYFFKSNNVHPKATGYNRYAETIYKLLK